MYSFSSASFTLAPNILLSSATDVFDLYRALLPSHYAPQIRDVPTISMQVHNDALHLAARVDELSKLYPEWTASGDVITRLHGLADHIFENQLEAQKEGLMETIDQARGFALGTDVGLKNAEKAISGVVHNIETLSKVLNVRESEIELMTDRIAHDDLFERVGVSPRRIGLQDYV